MSAAAERSAVDPSAGQLGHSLVRYERLGEIGSGGMATVYLGRARGPAGFERLVAIKCCHPHLRSDPRFASMFLEEARLAARIRHLNVVPTLDVGGNDPLYLVMDYVDGARLSDLLVAATTGDRGLPADVTLRIVVDMLNGLHAAHELRDAEGTPLNLIHRDVSPQNVLVGLDGVARLLDFGIAKAAAQPSVTRDGQVRGKLAYMAPEQLTGEAIGRQTDIFAAAVVLWEALTSQRLFAGANEGETTRRVIRARVAPPSSLAPWLAPEIDAVVLRALARRPHGRFATAAEFAEAIESAGMPLASPRQVGACVTELAGTAIAERRERAYHVAQHATEAITLGATSDTTLLDEREPDTAEPVLATDTSDARRRESRWRSAGVLAALAACVAAMGTAWLVRSPPPATATMDRPVPRVTAPNAVVAPAVVPIPNALGQNAPVVAAAQNAPAGLVSRVANDPVSAQPHVEAASARRARDHDERATRRRSGSGRHRAPTPTVHLRRTPQGEWLPDGI